MNTFSGRMFYENGVRVCFPLRLGCWIILISTIEVFFLSKIINFSLLKLSRSPREVAISLVH